MGTAWHRLAGLTTDQRIALAKQRMLAKANRSDDGCWEYLGGRSRAGYGALNVRLGGRDAPKVMLYAHRVFYEELVGPIPHGLEIDHLCRNKGCVNPAHLEPVTHGENVRRAGWLPDDVPCPAGHVGDFYRHPVSGRWCNVCRRQQGMR